MDILQKTIIQLSNLIHVLDNVSPAGPVSRLGYHRKRKITSKLPKELSYPFTILIFAIHDDCISKGFREIIVPTYIFRKGNELLHGHGHNATWHANSLVLPKGDNYSLHASLASDKGVHHVTHTMRMKHMSNIWPTQHGYLKRTWLHVATCLYHALENSIITIEISVKRHPTPDPDFMGTNYKARRYIYLLTK